MVAEKLLKLTLRTLVVVTPEYPSHLSYDEKPLKDTRVYYLPALGVNAKLFKSFSQRTDGNSHPNVFFMPRVPFHWYKSELRKHILELMPLVGREHYSEDHLEGYSQEYTDKLAKVLKKLMFDRKLLSANDDGTQFLWGGKGMSDYMEDLSRVAEKLGFQRRILEVEPSHSEKIEAINETPFLLHPEHRRIFDADTHDLSKKDDYQLNRAAIWGSWQDFLREEARGGDALARTTLSKINERERDRVLHELLLGFWRRSVVKVEGEAPEVRVVLPFHWVHGVRPDSVSEAVERLSAQLSSDGSQLPWGKVETHFVGFDEKHRAFADEESRKLFEGAGVALRPLSECGPLKEVMDERPVGSLSVDLSEPEVKPVVTSVRKQALVEARAEAARQVVSIKEEARAAFASDSQNVSARRVLEMPEDELEKELVRRILPTFLARLDQAGSGARKALTLERAKAMQDPRHRAKTLTDDDEVKPKLGRTLAPGRKPLTKTITGADVRVPGQAVVLKGAGREGKPVEEAEPSGWERFKYRQRKRLRNIRERVKAWWPFGKKEEEK